VIISASTVKDTRANVEKFVRRNLLGGIDHVVLFLDAPMPDVEAFAEEHPDVTWVPAYGAWWGDLDPGGLNTRQITNAALASRLVAGFAWAEWMFMLDGDEVARIDRGTLDALPADCRAVRLLPLEAASRLHPEGDPTLFKRLLSEEELQLLHVLGVIEAPAQRSYFRGHVSGKPGVRPTPGLALGVHHVVATGVRERQEAVTAPGLRLLHYESHSGEEFVRKWMALLSSGGDVVQHKNRIPLASAISALLALDLGEDETAAFLERLYVQTALDDIDTLSRLGLLVEIDPDAGTRGTPPGVEDVDQLRALMRLAYEAPKRVFRPSSDNVRADRVISRIQGEVR
jgi:hypothetical protein